MLFGPPPPLAQQRFAAKKKSSYLLHNTSFALGKRNVSTRLIGDELDLNLSSLAAALLVVVVIVIVGWALAFGAATLAWSAIAGVVVKLSRRGLVVLVCDVGHFGLIGITKSLKR